MYVCGAMGESVKTTMLLKITLCVLMGVVTCSLAYLVQYRSPVMHKAGIPLVVCTTSMLADAVKNIGGDHVQVVCLMGPGVDPHMYRPSQSDIFHLVEADLVIYQGLHLEGKMVELFQHLATQGRVVAAAHVLPLELLRVTGVEGMFDPHVWHAVPLWSRVVDTVGDALIDLDPTHAEDYRAGVAQYQASLADLHAWITAQIARLPSDRRIFVTAHDAFSYFGDTYGIRVISLQGINTTVPVTIGQVREIVDTILTHRVPALFVEASVPLRTLTCVQEALALAGHTVIFGDQLYSDTLEAPDTPTGTYVGMMKHNVTALVNALLGNQRDA